MGFIKTIKQLFAGEELPKEVKPRQKKTKQSTQANLDHIISAYSVDNVAEKKVVRKKKQRLSKVNSDLETATSENRPFVDVVSLDINYENPMAGGSFDIVWNKMFIDQLRSAGFQGKTDEQIIDQWFTSLCRHVSEENWEQEQADPDKRIQRVYLGGGLYEAR